MRREAAAFAVALAAVALAALSPAAHAAAGCGLGDLDGTFAFVVHGTNPLGQPFGAIGTLTADGAGNIDGIRISLDNGEYDVADFTCTYSMLPACAFRGPCVDDGELVAEVQIDGVLADNGKQLMLLLTGIPAGPGGAVVTGTATQQ